MNTPTSEYMLLFRGLNWDKDLPRPEVEKGVEAFMAWFERLQHQGKCKGGQPLKREGKVVSAKRGVSDGPFVESKEAIGGYFMLTVSSLDEAVAIAQQCPVLKYGLEVEVRPIADECPMLHEQTATKRLAVA